MLNGKERSRVSRVRTKPHQILHSAKLPPSPSFLPRSADRGLIVYARKTPPTHTSPSLSLLPQGDALQCRVRASKSTISNILYRESIVCKTVLYYAKKCNVFCHQGYPYHPRLRQPGKKGLSLVARSVLESPANGQLAIHGHAYGAKI